VRQATGGGIWFGLAIRPGRTNTMNGLATQLRSNHECLSTMNTKVIRHEMSERELQLWQALIELRCGMYFGETRLQYLRNRLWERMQALGLESYLDYYAAVVEPRGAHEWTNLLPYLVNNETGFFRHEPSYEALVDAVLPEVMKQKRTEANRTIRLWSAGCSTGEEPYSLGMVALHAGSSHADKNTDWRFSIVGSDISNKALKHARGGRFPERAVERVTSPLLRLHLSRYCVRHDGSYEMTDAVKSVVHFDSFNLIEPATYTADLQDVIFCQNVLIYFRMEIRAEIVRHLTRRLSLGGYLFLAPGEGVGLDLSGLRNMRQESLQVFRRVGQEKVEQFNA
jgi:chemotaxis methyl-accepting protein methylase